MRWCCGACSTATQPQAGEAVGAGVLGEDRVALFGGGAGDVAGGFVAAEQDEQHLAGQQLVQSKTGAYEGHRTDLGGNVEREVGCDVWGFGHRSIFASFLFCYLGIK